MATVTHYIRSEYDADVDRDRLLLETGQVSDDAVDPDPWQTESSSAGYHHSHRLANVPKFVPAHLSYDEWGTPSTRTQPTTLTTFESRHGDVSTWYRSLGRQGAHAPGPTQPLAHPESPSHSNANVKYYRSLEATPEPSSSSSPPPIAPPASSPSPANATDASTLPSSAQLAAQRYHRGSHDWFISRAISSQSQFLSAPPTPRPGTGNSSTSGDSLADMLARHPPSAQPFRPPVFLHLGPSNKGWAMLQNQGWSEGEGLGAGAGSGSDGSSRVSATDTQPEESWRTTQKEKARKRTRPSPPLSSQERTITMEEVLVDHDKNDPIIEVRRKKPVPVIDLTRSDTEEDEDDDDSSENDDENDAEHDYFPSPFLSPINIPPPATSDPTDPTSDPRAAQTALLTPLPTILKSDRLGIGLKAKTESIGGSGGGAYRTTVKRVTPNAAALAAHLKAAEDVRRTQRQLGKGRTAFARAERIERERRQNMMAYLSEP